MTQTDAQTQPSLASRLATQEAGAIDEFYQEYRGRILAVAYKFVSDSWDAEEILQDVMLTVHRKAHTFRGDSDIWFWVHRVTQNAARMHLRKHKRAPIPVEDRDMETMVNSHESAPSPHRPDEIANLRLAIARMHEQLNQLDPVNRELYEDLDVVGRSKEDVAAKFGLTVGAVKGRLHRVRVALRSAAYPAAA